MRIEAINPPSSSNSSIGPVIALYWRKTDDWSLIEPNIALFSTIKSRQLAAEIWVGRQVAAATCRPAQFSAASCRLFKSVH